jgi:hypothetical protein
LLCLPSNGFFFFAEEAERQKFQDSGFGKSRLVVHESDRKDKLMESSSFLFNKNPNEED